MKTVSKRGAIGAVMTLMAATAPLTAYATSADFDGVPDLIDNCLDATNPDQRDTDGDNIGNQCDGDFNNDCIVNVLDLASLKANFFATGDLDQDMNGDGAVNPIDLGLFRQQFFQLPGPSGLADPCDGPGPYSSELWVHGSWDFFQLPPSRGQLLHVGNDRYVALLTLDGAVHRFRVGDAFLNPNEVNCNPAEDNTPAILNIDLPLTCGPANSDALIDLSLEPDGETYAFILDAGGSLTEPVIRVRRVDDLPLFLPGDTTPPTFLGPLSIDPPDQPASFGLAIAASVEDDFVVAWVDFHVDGMLLWRDFTEPYQAPWDTTRFGNGARVLTAAAVDANGNTALSDPLFVDVQNPSFGPFGTQMFVRGAFVDDPGQQFGTQHPLALVSDDLYEASVNIDRTMLPPTEFSIAFKVADAGWMNGTDCGSMSGAGFAMLGQAIPMVCSPEDNGGIPSQTINLLLIGQPQPANYLFKVDVTGYPDTAPTVTVTLED